VRSTDDLRSRFLDTVAGAVRRPGMFAVHDQDLDLFFRTWFADLCFLDGDDDRPGQVVEDLAQYGPFGVAGPFRSAFGRSIDFKAEVASVWAEVMAHARYYDVPGQVVRTPWDVFLARLSQFDERDARASDVWSTLGPPSLVVDGRVYCYAPENRRLPWVFFDFVTESWQAYDYGLGRNRVDVDPDPLLRDVRVPAESFPAGLILTAYGKLARWGPHWWLTHSKSPQKAAEQQLMVRVRRLGVEDPVPAPSSQPR
jgi:hypothetical protein